MDQDRNENELETLVKRIKEVTIGLLSINYLEARLLMEHCEENEPFYNVTLLEARSSLEHPSFEDLRFLKLFPNTRTLFVYDSKDCSQCEAKIMSFDGIQNCPNLGELYASIQVPPILTGIEFCTELKLFDIDVIHDGVRPMDITPLSELLRLESIDTTYEVVKCITVETEGLDLSGCKSLKTLSICPTSKDLRFLGSVQLERLCVPCSGIESLDGLDTTNLNLIDIRDNQITCIEKLRGARLKVVTSRGNLEGNPIDPNVLEEIINSWV